MSFFRPSLPSVALAGACLALSLACGGGKLDPSVPSSGNGGIAITGAAGAGNVGGAAGAGSVSGGGATGIGGDGNIGGSIGIGGAPSVMPCQGPSDPRMVVAPQRRLQLTAREAVNMVRVLVDEPEAAASAGLLPQISDIDLWFPPASSDSSKIVDQTTMAFWTNFAKHVAQYVFDNFAALTACSPATDACAKSYLSAFAEKAYRRPLDAGEQGAVEASYADARSTDGAIEAAVQAAIAKILVAPQFLYRSEWGAPGAASPSDPVPLTQHELASALSFFLTDGPPDQPLRDDARAGTLTPDRIAAHVDRLLTTPAARDWLRTVVETLFYLNQLPGAIAVIDTTKFPQISPGMLADMQTEVRKFLDLTLWNGTLAGLLTSRTTFLNSTLATMIYKVPVPPGATATTWVQTTLPATERSGLLTNAGFLTTVARSDRAGVGIRGWRVSHTMTGYTFDPHPPEIGQIIATSLMNARTQTAQEQVAYRAAIPFCRSCHVHLDGYGVALDNYDNIGIFRTIDELGKPVDAHATMPPEAGGGQAANAIDVATALAASPAFTNQMAWAMLQHAMVDFFAAVELPDPSNGRPGCAVADVVTRLQNNHALTFRALVREVALSPAFSLRRPAVITTP